MQMIVTCGCSWRLLPLLLLMMVVTCILNVLGPSAGGADDSAGGCVACGCGASAAGVGGGRGWMAVAAGGLLAGVRGGETRAMRDVLRI